MECLYNLNVTFLLYVLYFNRYIYLLFNSSISMTKFNWSIILLIVFASYEYFVLF